MFVRLELVKLFKDRKTYARPFTFVSMEASLRPVSKLLKTVVTASISMSDSSRLLSVLMFAQEQDMFPLSPTHTRLMLSTKQNVIIAAT